MKNLQQFGKKIQELRIKSQQSITDVAKVLGVDRTYLSKMENGRVRPSPRVLGSLISHYSLSPEEVAELQFLFDHKIGSVAADRKEVKPEMKDIDTPKPQLNAAQFEVRLPDSQVVLYTDSVLVTRSPFGIVFDFAQTVGSTNKQNVVSRVGMSLEHAKALHKVLGDKLNEVENKKRENIN